LNPSSIRSRPLFAQSLFVLLALLLALATLLELRTGAIDIGIGTLWQLLRGNSVDPVAAQALLQLRLPRLVVAVLVGAALAQSGAAMQALFRNPLAEPGLVGVSAGAALAAAAVFAGLPYWIGSLALQAWLLPLAAFAGGLATAVLVLRIARAHGITRMTTLLLTGAAVNAFVAAMVGLLAATAGDNALRGFTLWLYGDLGRAGWPELAVAGPLLLAAILWLPREGRALDALLLGDAEAAHLGVDVESLRRRVLLLAVLAAACAVALAGMIGFVGLIVPHAIRLLAGPGHRRLLPASALLGAAVLIFADVVARRVAAPAELPVGILTALLGAPFFVLLLLRVRDRAESL
jgi:iron complex transport system permease protein